MAWEYSRPRRRRPPAPTCLAWTWVRSRVASDHCACAPISSRRRCRATFEAQGQEARGDVPDLVVAHVVVDGPDGEDGLPGLKRAIDPLGVRPSDRQKANRDSDAPAQRTALSRTFRSWDPE